MNGIKKDTDSYLGSPSKQSNTYVAAEDRYDKMIYRRLGKSGLKVPVITLGLWQNFGDEASYTEAKKMLLRAFDLGITHFDLANNYGKPAGSAEKFLGRVLSEDLKGHRDELVISTKAGYDMWKGPYGEWGSKKYLVASLDQSLKRMGLDYVDIFYSHRFDKETPLQETMGALHSSVTRGKALYAGISSYGMKETLQAEKILRNLGTPLTVHQPSYSLFNRWIEKDGLLQALKNMGTGCISFSGLEQGLLSDKYANGIPQDSRMANPDSLLKKEIYTTKVQLALKELSNIAKKRGQTLTQMSLAWTIKNSDVTSTIIGVKSVKQLEENLEAIKNLHFSKDELKEINVHAKDLGITLWPANC